MGPKLCACGIFFQIVGCEVVNCVVCCIPCLTRLYVVLFAFRGLGHSRWVFLWDGIWNFRLSALAAPAFHYLIWGVPGINLNRILIDNIIQGKYTHVTTVQGPGLARAHVSCVYFFCIFMRLLDVHTLCSSLTPVLVHSATQLSTTRSPAICQHSPTGRSPPQWLLLPSCPP
jgi:hypothetical protein